jgi:hypothetical protein
VVTLDDGYADNDIYALPILQKYGIKANLMLATGLVGGNPDMLSLGPGESVKRQRLNLFYQSYLVALRDFQWPTG